MTLSVFLWKLSVICIPLFFFEKTYLFNIPLTFVLMVFSGFLNFNSVFLSRTTSLVKYIQFFFTAFFILALIDLTRSINAESNLTLLFKILILLITFRINSYFISKLSLKTFFRILSISSCVVLMIMIYKSYVILNAPFFVVDSDIVTESGKNKLALYLAFLIPVIIYSLKLNREKKVLTGLLFISLLTHLFALIYVQSKGLILCLLIAFLISSSIFFKKRSSIIYVIAFLLLLLPLTPYLLDIINIQDFSEDFRSLFDSSIDKSSSSNERIELIAKSLNFFSESHLFGIGSENFAEIENKATHNSYLQVLAENGIIGIIVVLLVLFKIRKNLKYNGKSSLAMKQIFYSFIFYLFVINAFFSVISVLVFSTIASQYFIKNENDTNHTCLETV